MITTEEELQRALRNPPPGTPATMRGHYIREFSSEECHLAVNWHQVVIESAFDGKKTVALSRYASDRRVSAATTRQNAPHGQ